MRFCFLSACSQIPVELAEARLKCLLRRIVSSVASRLFAALSPSVLSPVEAMGCEQQRRQQQHLLRRGARALQEISADLGLERSELYGAVSETLPLLLVRLVSIEEMQTPVLSPAGMEAASGASGQMRVAATRILEGLRRAVTAAETFSAVLLGPEAAADTPRMLVPLAARRLLPALSFTLLAHLAADSAENLSGPIGLSQAADDSSHRKDTEIAPGPSEAAAFADGAFREMRRLLQLRPSEFLAAAQIGLFRAAAPLRRFIEVFSIMSNKEALFRVTRQLLVLDAVRL